MIKIFISLFLTSMLLGCGVKSLVVPLVGIPASNYLTREYYEEKHQLYDEKYDSTVNFKTYRIPRDGYTIYAREFGGTSDELKPVIILMHGFPDSLHLYDRIAPLLTDGYRVVSFDFLGWGKSDKPENHNYNTASLYQDLEAVISYINVEEVSLVVHDASGPPGIEWALNNPSKMDTLVLLNTYYYPMEGMFKPEAIANFSTPGIMRTILRTGAGRSNLGWKIGYQDQLAKFFYDEVQRDILMPVLTHQSLDIRNAFFQLNEVLDKESLQRSKNKQLLTEFEGEVKIIFGNEDPYLNSKVAKEFDRVFPNSSLFLIDQASHFVQLDKPEEVAKIILDNSNIQVLPD